MLKYVTSTTRPRGKIYSGYNDSFKSLESYSKSGDTINGMTQRISALRPDRNIDRVILMVGTNDLQRRYSQSQFKNHYDLLVSAVKKSFPVAVVFCFHILPRLDSASIPYRQYISSYNAAIRVIARERALQEVPVPSVFNPKKHLTTTDSLHLNWSGTEVMRVNIKQVIADFNNRSNTCEKVKLPDLLHFKPDYLHATMLGRVKKYLELRRPSFRRQGSHTSKIMLWGDCKYVYNRASADLDPEPIDSAPVLSDLLTYVNDNEGTSFNSILVNYYSGNEVSLAPHKDDEPNLVTTAPIATLSIGADCCSVHAVYKAAKFGHSWPRPRPNPTPGSLLLHLLCLH
jgi:lysophospholipase L1-like esterase/alkylated DNA repair dioxygenase AlkB